VRAAVVNSDTNLVVNVIVVNSLDDIAPENCCLIDVDHMVCSIGWVYDPVINDFVDPNLPPLEEAVDGN
jgi:hypothetical protein